MPTTFEPLSPQSSGYTAEELVPGKWYLTKEHGGDKYWALAQIPLWSIKTLIYLPFNSVQTLTYDDDFREVLDRFFPFHGSVTITP